MGQPLPTTPNATSDQEYFRSMMHQVLLREITLGTAVTAVLLALIIAIFAVADMILRFRDGENLFRWLGCLSLVASFTWLVSRMILGRAKELSQSTQFACRIDDAYPEFNDLSKTLSQLQSRPSNEAGVSSGLKDYTVRLGWQKMQNVDVTRLAPTGRIYMALITAVLVGALVSAGLGYSGDFRKASVRIMLPMIQLPWDLKPALHLHDRIDHHPENERLILEFNPGQPLNVFATNRTGELPDELWLEVEGESNLIPFQNPHIPDSPHHEIASAVLVTPTPGKRVRVTATTASSEWYTLKDRHSIRLQSFHWRLVPPDYSGLPEQEFDEGVVPATVLVGSRLVFSGRLTRSPENLVIQHGGLNLPIDANPDDPNMISFEVPTKQEIAPVVTLLVSENSETPAKVIESFAWTKLRDRPPVVSLEPLSNSVSVTSHGIWPVRVRANDDFGISYVGLGAIRKSDLNSHAVVPIADFELASSDTQPGAFTEVIDVSPFALGTPVGETLLIMASVNDSMRPVQSVKTPEVDLRIVSHEDKLVELESRITALVSQLQQLHDFGNRIVDSRRLDRRSDNDGPFLDSETQTRLLAFKRKFHDTFHNEDHGIAIELGFLIDEFRNNRLDAQPLARAVQGADAIVRDHFDGRASSRQIIAPAIEDEQSTFEANMILVETVMDELATPSQFIQIVRELRNIREQQIELRKRLETLASRRDVNFDDLSNSGFPFVESKESIVRQQRKLAGDLQSMVPLLPRRKHHLRVKTSGEPVSNANSINPLKLAQTVRAMQDAARSISIDDSETAIAHQTKAIHEIDSILSRNIPSRDTDATERKPGLPLENIVAQQQALTKKLTELHADMQSQSVNRSILKVIRDLTSGQLTIRKHFHDELPTGIQDQQIVRRIDLQMAVVVGDLQAKRVIQSTIEASKSIVDQLIEWSSELQHAESAPMTQANRDPDTGSNPGKQEGIDNSTTNTGSNSSEGDYSNRESEQAGGRGANAGTAVANTGDGPSHPFRKGIDAGEVDRVFWGQLPPDSRKAMRSTFPVEFPPEYSADIRRYFERLSERKSKR